MIRIPNLPTVSTPQRSSVRMPGVSPQTPDFAKMAAPRMMEVSGRDMAAPFLALANVGDAVAGLGDKLGRISEAQFKMKRRNDLAEADITFKEAAGRLEIDLASDPNPATRIQRYDEVMGKTMAELMSREYDPQTKSEIEMQLRGLNASYRTRVAVQSIAAGLAAERGRGDNVVMRYEAAGEYDKAAEYITGLPDAVLPPEAKDKAVFQLQQKAIDAQATRAMEADPAWGIESLKARDENGNYLNFQGLPEDRRRELAGFAERKLNEQQRERLDSLIRREIVGGDDAPTAKEIAEEVKFGRLDPAAGHAWIKRLEAENPPLADPNIVNDIYERIDQFDPESDFKQNDAGMRSLLRDIGVHLDPISKGLAMDRIKAKLDKKPTHPGAGVAREYLIDVRNARRAAMPGQWQMEEITDPETGEPTTIRRRVMSRDAMDQLSKEHARDLDTLWQVLQRPEAKTWTNEQLMMEVQKAIPHPGRAAGAASILGDKGSPMAALGTLLGDDAEPLAPPPPPAVVFGGVELPRMGETISNVKGSVFGGTSDPADSGVGFTGKKTGPGGVEGVAMPQGVMDAWGVTSKGEYEKFRVIVWNGANREVFPIVDRGTAESVVEKHKRFVLDFTEGAVKKAGGSVIYKDGKQAGVTGLDNLKFAVVPVMPVELKGREWDEVLADLAEMPLDSDTAYQNAMLVLRHEWQVANAQQ